MPFIFIIGILVFVIDQATKFWIRTGFLPGHSHPIIPGLFHLTFVTNTGSAFGLFPGGSIIFIFLSVLAVIILVSAACRKGKDFSPLVKFSLGLVLGGVAGNLTDRLRFGAVVDFLDFRIWPVFNVGDCGITIGVILLSFHLLKTQGASRTL